MPCYESVFIARQDISTPQVEALTEAFAGVIGDNGGEIKKREYWGLRSLAYRIKKNRKGHYVLFNIDSPAGAVQEMERQMQLHEDVLRFMTIRVDELEEGPSAMMQSRDRGERGDRPRRDRDDRPRREYRDRNGEDRGDRGDRGDRETKPKDEGDAA